MSDSFFGPAYIDIDEWRDAPQRHRYVHGGFKDTDTRFSFYFPPTEGYAGRLLQTLEGGSGGSENTAAGAIGFGALGLAFSCGAFLIESNQGHVGEDLSGLRGDASILGWRASAQSALYAKEMAKEMYGEEPHHGYVLGGSGGGIRSILCLENVEDIWDGAVPFMFPHQMTLEFFSTQLNAVRVLSPEQLLSISDAVDVGGSGNPYEGLTIAQRETLASLYRLGFPHTTWLEDPMEAQYVWTWDASWLSQMDPGFFDDFWTVRGYAGADMPEVLAPSVIELETTVVGAVTAAELAASSSRPLRADPAKLIGVRVAGLNLGDERLMGATLTFLSGEGAGNEVYCLGMVGDVLMGNSTGWLFEGVEPGDKVLIDNRKFVAFCHYDRHQANDDYAEHEQHRVDGQPIFPQRPPFNVAGALHGRYAYHFTGKMIAIMNTLDRGAWPCGGASYHERARRHFGDGLDDHFRLWWNDNASHMTPIMLESISPPYPHYSTRLIDYTGSVHQAVLDLIDWVENGKEPPVNTSYEFSPDGRLTLAEKAGERGGIQPVVNATVNGGVRADVKAGEKVNFEASADVPRGTGRITAAEWDFEGKGTWDLKEKGIDGKSDSIKLKATHTFDTPGTYFPVVRVTSQRDGDANADYGSLPNLGRVRVVVS